MISDYLFLAGSLSRVSLPILKWADRPEILVEPQEFDLYRSTHPDLKLHTLPASGKGFSYMMNQMISICVQQEKRYFVFCDDDVYGLKRRAKLSDPFKRIKPTECTEVLDGLVEICKSIGAAQLAVSFAAGSWAAKKSYIEPTGAWGMYVCDSYAVRSVGGFDESLWIFSDWEMSARLIQAGYRCVRTNLVTFEHKMKSMEGGASFVYSQPEKVKLAAYALQRKYGEDAIKVSWVEEHGQYEPRFNWRKIQPVS